ncbi:MAG: CDP-glucose 4,6-dehydratase [Bacteroidota bacterium]
MVAFTNLFGGVYSGKRVLVTGHTGFKGSWLIHWLYLMGADVYGFALESLGEPNHFMWAPPVHSIIGDIRDEKKIARVCAEIKPDIVFHLAAQALVRDSYDNPVETFSSNVMGTTHVLEACRNTQSVKAVVVVSSDKCYENREWIWGYRENDPMGGFDPYSASKGCTELVTASYRNSFFNSKDYGTKHTVLVASARAGNVIGGGDWAKDRLVPDIVKAASLEKSVFIRNPLATRPWQHVLEPLSGYLTLGWRLLEGKTEYADAWNFGPDQESNLRVNEIVKRAQKEWSTIQTKYSKNKADVHEANLLMLDCSKANKLLKWKSVWNIDETIRNTIRWYKNFYDSGQINTHDDLELYVSNAFTQKTIWTQ